MSVRMGLLDGQREQVMPLCVVCNGKDAKCDECAGTGRFRVQGDPKRDLPTIYYRVAQMADAYFENGIPPIAGGALDQANWFFDAASFCHSDRNRIINEQTS